MLHGVVLFGNFQNFQFPFQFPHLLSRNLEISKERDSARANRGECVRMGAHILTALLAVFIRVSLRQRTVATNIWIAECAECLECLVRLCGGIARQMFGMCLREGVVRRELSWRH